MTPFLLYIARSGLYLGLFHAFYLLVMRRTTFFRMNRLLLLAGSYLCLVLPLLRLRAASATSVVSEWTGAGVGGEQVASVLQQVFPLKTVLLAVYVAGAIAVLTLYLMSARRIFRMIRNGEPVERDGCRLIILEQDVPSFNWGRNIVISRKDIQDYPAIYTHELMHVQCRHSLDLLIFLPVQILFWWNPLVWITREELRLLHEYEADEGVIQKGIDATQYQLLLVRKAVGEQRFSLASGFQHAKLKNRIEMMLKPDSSLWMRWSYLALIPVLVVFMFACNPARESQEAMPYQLIYQKPMFNGGDANKFSQWVNSQVNYPLKARTDLVQGRVTLQFTVGTDGTVRDVKVLRGVREDLDAEALRVVSSSPKWTPGRNSEGEIVPVIYTFPIIFQLK